MKESAKGRFFENEKHHWVCTDEQKKNLKFNFFQIVQWLLSQEVYPPQGWALQNVSNDSFVCYQDLSEYVKLACCAGCKRRPFPIIIIILFIVLFRLKSYRCHYILSRLSTTQVECAVRPLPETPRYFLLLLSPLQHDVHEELDLVLVVVLHVPALLKVQVRLAALQVLLRVLRCQPTVWSLVWCHGAVMQLHQQSKFTPSVKWP